MASLVNRGTTTLRARSTLPEAWTTWTGGGVRRRSKQKNAAGGGATHHPERSKQEVQKLLSIGVLDVVLQLPLSAHTHTHSLYPLAVSQATVMRLLLPAG